MRSSEPDDELIIELYVQAERTAARLVGRDRAADIAGETIVRALSRWPRVASFPHAWVTRVAVNLAIDQLRKRQPGFALRPPESFEDDTVRRMSLVGELRRLPRRQREVVALHYLLGFSDAEVAGALRLSMPTVKTHLARALATLRLNNSFVTEVNIAPHDPT